MNRNETLENSTTKSNHDDKDLFLNGTIIFFVLLVILVILCIIFKRIYHKYFKKKNNSAVKLKKNEVKSIYDDKFGINENEHENIRDKSMIKEFLENNIDLKKKDDLNFKRDDKNFNYISAKNVFNIEGEESEYHYENNKKNTNKNQTEESNEFEEEMQFSQENSRTQNEPINYKTENSVINVLN